MNPATFILNRRLEEFFETTKTKRSEFIQRAGYRNIMKGLRVLDRFRETGLISYGFATRVCEAMGIPHEEARELIHQQTEEVGAAMEEARRREFRPYVFVKTERIHPTQITMAAFGGVGALKRQAIPEDLLTDNPNETLLNLQSMARQIYEDLQGEIIFFGKITGFICYLDFDDPNRNVELDHDAQPVKWGIPVPRRGPRLSVSLRGRDISGIFRTLAHRKAEEREKARGSEDSQEA